MLLQGQVGPQVASDSAFVNVRQGKLGDVITSELHGRFYEQTYRGNMFSWGKTITALSANSVSLTSSTTPIIGVWNPSTSTVNLVILQAAVQAVINTVTTPVGLGAFVWAVSSGNSAISTGNAPWNRKTLAQSGSQAKGFDLATALTGLSNNLVIMDEADMASPTALTYGTIASTALALPYGGEQNFDGSLIVPPGGVLALLNTTSTTTMSAVARLMWEEVAL